MSKRLRITVTEYTDMKAPNIIARFDYTDDAQKFAEAITEGTDRIVEITDVPGYVNLWYQNGMTTGLKTLH